MLAVLGLTFLILAALGMPIAFALGLSSLVAMLYAGFEPIQIAGKMVHAVDSFPLMAIPLFMLAGQLMIRGGIMGPLIDFANAVMGRVRGGLGHVTIASAMAFSSVSGVAVADATALGGTLGPALSKVYLGDSQPVSLPPRLAWVRSFHKRGDDRVRGRRHQRVGGGVVHGRHPPRTLDRTLDDGDVFLDRAPSRLSITGEPFSFANLLRQTRRSILVFLMPVIVIGGIVAGIFTPTEGGAIAVVYALVIGFGVTRQLRLADLPPALLNAAIISAVVGALIRVLHDR